MTRPRIKPIGKWLRDYLPGAKTPKPEAAGKIMAKAVTACSVHKLLIECAVTRQTLANASYLKVKLSKM